MAGAPAPVLESAARAALAERTLMRRRFLPFVKRYEPQYQAGWVHELICRRLERFSEAVANRESPRLMILMPPRSGKSRLASVRFPSWHLGRYPTHEYISASYNVNLPVGFSRHIRALFDDPTYQVTFPDARLDPSSMAAENWLLTLGGGYLAAGVGGGITGRGAHVLTIDDPVKNHEEADSALSRDATWDWYGSTAYTRLAPGGGVLVIQTWWNDDDLCGRIQTEMREAEVDDDSVDRFEVLKFPAIAEEEEWLTPGDTIWRPSDDEAKPEGATKLRDKGDALHPARFDLKALTRIKRTLEPRHWAALYQQSPIPDEGLFFSKDMFKPIEPRVEGPRNVYQAWDFAISEKDMSAYTVGATGALDTEDNLEFLDVVRGKMDGSQIVEAILDAYALHKPLEVGVERGQIWLAIQPLFQKRCRERRLYPPIKELAPISDKVARARPLQGRMQLGRVKWNTKAPWYDKLVHEFLRFPGGTYKDQVDACAWLGQMTIGNQAPRAPAEKKRKSWKDKLNGLIGDKGVSHMAA